MVFIHGGGWVFGDGGLGFYGPERLLDEDVVRREGPILSKFSN